MAAAGGVPAQVSRCRKPSTQPVLRHQSISRAHAIGSFSSRRSTLSPAGEDLLRVRVEVAAVAVGEERVHLLQDTSHWSWTRVTRAVAERDGLPERRVVRDLVQALHRPLDAEVAGEAAVLDQLQDQRRRPRLEERRDLAHVRVADDDVQAAEAVGAGVRLVPGVDDRALERRLQADLDLEEVRALADLETRGAALLARGRRGRRRRSPGGRRRTASGA
jgi:hypothetical protein